MTPRERGPVNESFDFVVIGSGGGSMCAALVMREAGHSVLVLEKTDLVGGTTAISGGVMWIPGNPFLQAAGIEDSRERANAYLDAVVGDSDGAPGANRRRRRAYVEEAPAMIDFLLRQGLRLRRLPSWPDYYAAPGECVPGRTVVSELFDINQLGAWKSRLRPGFLPLPANLDEAMQLPYLKRSGQSRKTLLRILGRTLVSRLAGRHLVTAGQALQGQMLKAALAAGAEIRTNAGARQLICEDGRVTGVVTERDGGDWRIGARLGVLINAGGFSRNQRMLDRYIPGTSTDWTTTAPGDTGEMIEEAMRIGAAVAQMDARVGNPVVLPPGEPPVKPVVVHGDLAKPHAIVVDQSGVRYMRESSSYMQIGAAMLARNAVAPAIPSWLIVDSQYTRKYMLAGTMPSPGKLKRWLEQGFLLRGDTVDALANACGMDARQLTATVERFNHLVRRGRDDDFQRGDHVYSRWLGDSLNDAAPTLGTLETGPFYALRIYPGDVSTFGGVVTDEHARALREDGSVIPGLYATGTATASVMGYAAPGAGGSIGPSFTWGYVAAKHAAGSRP